jgi:hypothetical protein
MMTTDLIKTTLPLCASMTAHSLFYIDKMLQSTGVSDTAGQLVKLCRDKNGCMDDYSDEDDDEGMPVGNILISKDDNTSDMIDDDDDDVDDDDDDDIDSNDSQAKEQDDADVGVVPKNRRDNDDETVLHKKKLLLKNLPG